MQKLSFLHGDHYLLVVKPVGQVNLLPSKIGVGGLSKVLFSDMQSIETGS